MAKRPNEKNERIKRDYLLFRKHARQCSDKTLDSQNAALERFDVWNDRKDFARFHINWAMGFRAYLEREKSKHGKPLAKSTQRAILATLRDFTIWLSRQDGFRRRVKLQDADYFRLSLRDEAEARAAPGKAAPSVRQAKTAFAKMSEEKPRDLRDKAVFALLCLTGIRGKAMASLRIKHVDITEKSVLQNPREVETKFGKSGETFFAQGFEEAEVVLAKWLAYLDETALFGPDDPLFPKTDLKSKGTVGFEADGFKRENWVTTEPIRKIVNTAFANVDLPAFGPHAFRHMLARRAVTESKSVLELVANSKNLMHTDILTTLRSYGQISREDQRRLITGLDRSDFDE